MKLLKVGRSSACDIVLSSPKVSALHAEIVVLDNGDYILTDKGSTNGTFLMNKPIVSGKDINVKRGDLIRFGDTELDWNNVPMSEDMSQYKAIWGIGSKLGNEIVLMGNTVSRYHATIKKAKDGKIYITDHSTNGTMVNGNHIPKDSNYRIKRKDSIVCGGVTVPPGKLNDVFGGNDMGWLKYVAGIAAAAAVVALIVLLWPSPKWDAKKTYDQYSSSVAIVYFSYAYHATLHGEDAMETFFGVPSGTVMVPSGRTWVYNKSKGYYSGTAFFITEDGKLATNLHVARPWLYEDIKEERANLEDLIRTYLTASGQPNLIALLPELKIEGILTDMFIVLNGLPNSEGNRIKCSEYKAYDGVEDDRDVAIIQTETRQLPQGVSNIIDIRNADLEESAMAEGTTVFTIGYPLGSRAAVTSNQELRNQVHEGKITQNRGIYEFGHDAATIGGASGSPMTNNKGHLVGINHAGYNNTQGFNMAVKAKWIVDLLNN